MRIAMIGSGYVGLVSGACFSEFGHSVDCVDHDPEKVSLLKSGEIPIYEPGLKSLIATNTREGRLFFSTDLTGAVKAAEIIFIAVGTPGRPDDGAADMKFVDDAALQIAEALDGFKVIVTKSTVSVGTARRLEGLIRKARPDADFAMVSNPEFLREGSAIEDFMRPDRIVVGVEDERAEDLMRQAYRPLSLRDAPLIMTDFETAELVKYANNAFLAMRLSFMNELSDLCEAVGANIGEAAHALGKDRRIGPYFLHPGPAYGGSCFPKDTRALISIGQAHDSPMQSIETTVKINDERIPRMVEKICAAMGGNVEEKKIAVLGISFKPNTDDIRESPALTIIPALQERGALITAHDPVARRNAEPVLAGVAWANDPLDAVEGADCLVILTEWNAYRGLDLKMVEGLMRSHTIVDLRNVFDLKQLAELPFTYHSLGRKPIER